MNASVENPREATRLPIVALAGLAAAVAFFALFATNDFDRRAIHWGRLQVFGLFVLPILPAIALLAVRRLREAGIAYAAGISTVASLALALPAGLILLFLAVATPVQRVDALALFGYAVSMAVVAVSAWRAHFRVPGERRQGKVATLSLVATAAYAVLVWGFFQATMGQPYDRRALIREYNDRQARKNVAAIADCARRQAGGGGERGYPATMAELLAGGCLPKRLQAGQPMSAGADGYAFYYFADPPDAKGKVARFAVCARPGREEDGTLTVSVDPAGGFNEMQAPLEKPTPSCFAAWAGKDDRAYLMAATACVLSGAARLPGRGYPPTLFVEQGSHAGACDFTMLEAAKGDRVPGDRVRTDRGVLEFRPQPEVAGVSRGYTLVFFPLGGGAPLETDQSGAVRALPPQGVAPTLEAVEAARPREELKRADADARRRPLVAACEAGDLAVCEDLGQFEMDNQKPEEADRWWDHACEKGRLQSCLLSGRYNPTTDPRSARSDKERCIQGEPRYCQRLVDEARLLQPRIEELRSRGGFQTSRSAQPRVDEKRRELRMLCDTGNAELCENLGDLQWDTQQHRDALLWWDRACEMGRWQACLLSESYNPGNDRERALALRDQCRQRLGNGCRDLEALVEKRRADIEAILRRSRSADARSGTGK
ncbi:MAG: hypothetical protein IPH30_12655 [Betaproteobacteria bacterium]|nr:hypothetical protein [Betaproteobacteria bacterium]